MRKLFNSKQIVFKYKRAHPLKNVGFRKTSAMLATKQYTPSKVYCNNSSCKDTEKSNRKLRESSLQNKKNANN